MPASKERRPTPNKAVVADRDSAVRVEKKIFVQRAAANAQSTRPPDIDARPYPQRWHCASRKRAREHRLAERIAQWSRNVFDRAPQELKHGRCHVCSGAVRGETRRGAVGR